MVGGENRLYATTWVGSSDEDSFSYVADRTLFLESVNGDKHELVAGSEGECPFCLSSFGWSPDGRYLGLDNIGGRETATIVVADTSTGELRTLLEEEDAAAWNPRWWR